MKFTATVVRLPPNKQWDQRVASFNFVTQSIGIMEVLEMNSKTGKKQSRRYAIRVEGFGTEGGVQFRCTKPGGKEFYTVIAGHLNPDLDTCDCPAGTMREDKVACTHKTALQSLVLVSKGNK